ncbi:TetR/AcrR family transcriptional regulator [Kaistella sp. G5-32]|uniref:TetR/AcrR family transcriptional regulator n=1 Tax=Kaistella gelatinilytica TaxID=2787636 RepID=A0ABS0F9K5_9FLAO|nr:TetR/AcrR family transcriptional regulator [Kaistella gelatinilytica]MBF8456330.1 TetR/AcrR family transcriptional regulator [Kaistella gelatinilytica]
MSADKEFLLKVAELFAENGAKTLTMDDIAKEFAMSKKTLYQHYKNKEDLLTEVLDYKLDLVVETLLLNDSKSENAIERMFLREKDFESFSRTNKTTFIRQLIKYYPSIYNQHILSIDEKISKIVTHNIKLGRDQGYYRTDFDERLYIKFLLQLMFSYEDSPLFENEVNDRQCFCLEVMVFYMHSIATKKGKDFLKDFDFKKEE